MDKQKFRNDLEAALDKRISMPPKFSSRSFDDASNDECETVIAIRNKNNATDCIDKISDSDDFQQERKLELLNSSVAKHRIHMGKQIRRHCDKRYRRVTVNIILDYPSDSQENYPKASNVVGKLNSDTNFHAVNNLAKNSSLNDNSAKSNYIKKDQVVSIPNKTFVSNMIVRNEDIVASNVKLYFKDEVQNAIKPEENFNNNHKNQIKSTIQILNAKSSTNAKLNNVGYSPPVSVLDLAQQSTRVATEDINLENKLIKPNVFLPKPKHNMPNSTNLTDSSKVHILNSTSIDKTNQMYVQRPISTSIQQFDSKLNTIPNNKLCLQDKTKILPLNDMTTLDSTSKHPLITIKPPLAKKCKSVSNLQLITDDNPIVPHNHAKSNIPKPTGSVNFTSSETDENLSNHNLNIKDSTLTKNFINNDNQVSARSCHIISKPKPGNLIYFKSNANTQSNIHDQISPSISATKQTNNVNVGVNVTSNKSTKDLTATKSCAPSTLSSNFAYSEDTNLIPVQQPSASVSHDVKEKKLYMTGSNVCAISNSINTTTNVSSITKFSLNKHSSDVQSIAGSDNSAVIKDKTMGCIALVSASPLIPVSQNTITPQKTLVSRTTSNSATPETAVVASVKSTSPNLSSIISKFEMMSTKTSEQNSHILSFTAKQNELHT